MNKSQERTKIAKRFFSLKTKKLRMWQAMQYTCVDVIVFSGAEEIQTEMKTKGFTNEKSNRAKKYSW